MKNLISLIAAAVLFCSMSVTHAASYAGTVTDATGTVGTLLGVPLPDVVGGYDGTDLFFDVGTFFFSNVWTGDCDLPAAMQVDPCVIGDTNYNGTDAFVPILNILVDTLSPPASGGVPQTGMLVFDSFSPTFGIPLGDTTIDLDAGTFGLVGALGTASGTGAFVPIPAAAWLFGSALLGLAGLRRRK